MTIASAPIVPPALDAIQALHLIKQIRPILAGQEPTIQGSVIADLAARWLAGHFVKGDPEATAKLRTELLADWLGLVDRLIPVNAKMLGTPV